MILKIEINFGFSRFESVNESVSILLSATEACTNKVIRPVIDQSDCAPVTKVLPPDNLELSRARDVTSVGNIPNLIPRQINK